jgi:rRNA processing protein Krr1/Pno1
MIIQEIMRRSGCKIVINQNNFPDGAPRKVVITGSSSQIPIAKSLVEAVINEGPGAIQEKLGEEGFDVDSSALVLSEMECPSEKVGIVIGSRGVIIQEIMRRSGCKIVVNQRVPDGAPSIVQITGKQHQIDNAKRLINSVIQNGPLALNGPSDVGTNISLDVDIVTEQVDCPAEKVGIVIGAKGVIINEIMRRSGTKIVINQDVPKGSPNIVVITGPRYRISAAKGLIANVISGGPSALYMSSMTGHSVRPTVHEFPIVQAQAGKLIGPGGSTIKEIQQLCGVRINVEAIPDSNERIVRVSGDPERVLTAVQVVWQLLNHSPQAAFAIIRGMGAGAAGPSRGGWAGDNRMQGGGQMGAMPMHGGAGWGPAPGQPQAWGRTQNPGPGVYSNMGASPIATPVVAAPGVQYLGADGKAGQLMPVTAMGGGYHHQIAWIHHTWFDALSGGANAPNLALIRTKSGARLSVDESIDADRLQVKIDIVGFFQNVSLAAQMIQEVLVFGTGRLEAMEDAKVGPGSSSAGGVMAPQDGGMYMDPSAAAAVPAQQPRMF